MSRCQYKVTAFGLLSHACIFLVCVNVLNMLRLSLWLCTGSRVSANAMKNLHYKIYLKIVRKLL